MELTQEIAYLVGFIGGDGNLSERRTALIDKNLEFHKTVLRKKFEKAFGIVPIISPMKTRKGRTTYRSRVNSKEIHAMFSENLRIPIRNKTFEMKTPQEITDSSKEIFSEYIKGWMDAEGWVTTKTTIRKTKTYVYPKIAFNVANKCIRDELVAMLRKIGIEPSIWKSGNMLGFQIIGFEKVNRYEELVGFEHPDKIRKLHILFARGQTRPTMRRTMGCNTVR